MLDSNMGNLMGRLLADLSDWLGLGDCLQVGKGSRFHFSFKQARRFGNSGLLRSRGGRSFPLESHRGPSTLNPGRHARSPAKPQLLGPCLAIGLSGDRRLWGDPPSDSGLSVGPLIVGADFVVWTGEVMNRNKKGPTHKKGPTRFFFPGAENAPGWDRNKRM